MSRAHIKYTQFTINVAVIYAYRLRFFSTSAYPNLAYSAANHVQNIFIPVNVGKGFIYQRRNQTRLIVNILIVTRNRFIFAQLLLN